MTTDLRVDGARLWASLERMAQIGATPKGGVCRLALPELDRESRDLFVEWARAAGCEVRIDQVGNIFARRPGRHADAAPVLTGSHAARNWIGVIGALISDITLQFFGIGSFLLPVFAALLGARWFRSSKIQSPIAKTLGGVWLVMFLPAMLALLPGHLHWMHVIPVEGLLGRIVGDFLIHYLNLVGAYIVCGTLIAVALYLSTAFSFAAVRLWAPTRFAAVWISGSRTGAAARDCTSASPTPPTTVGWAS